MVYSTCTQTSETADLHADHIHMVLKEPLRHYLIVWAPGARPESSIKKTSIDYARVKRRHMASNGSKLGTPLPLPFKAPRFVLRPPGGGREGRRQGGSNQSGPRLIGRTDRGGGRTRTTSVQRSKVGVRSVSDGRVRVLGGEKITVRSLTLIQTAGRRRRSRSRSGSKRSSDRRQIDDGGEYESAKVSPMSIQKLSVRPEC